MVPMDNCLRMSDIVNAAAAAPSSNGTPPAEWGIFESTPESGSNGHSGSSIHSQRTKWKPVVLLMPVRYGLEKLTERYIGNLKELFKLPQFLGIAGGRPGRSLYFVACQGESSARMNDRAISLKLVCQCLTCFNAVDIILKVLSSFILIRISSSPVQLKKN